MGFANCKVYFDGSHYIAIPYAPKGNSKNKRELEEDLVSGNEVQEQMEPENSEINHEKDDIECDFVDRKNQEENPKVDLKDKFEQLYAECRNLKRIQQKQYILNGIKECFDETQQAKEYVERQFERKLRNLICRKVRLVRKVNLQEFNYFCTFTYDNAKHTEESFKRKLQGCFKMMCHRKGWKYVGVWERSPEKQRLHFHGLFYIPSGSMPGRLIEVLDYSPVKKKVQRTIQNTYFNERFGRSDFEEVEDRTLLGNAIAYILKYIEKTDEKIVYSKGLPQYFHSDILDEDVVCRIGQEEKKLLLYDDFLCLNYGEVMGKVSKKTIERMRKSN